MNAQQIIEPVPSPGGVRDQQARLMRDRLIAAAVTVLRRVGYAATTMQLVIEEAGVSRGAVLHHFPTRIDMIVSVAQQAAKVQNRMVASRLASLSPGIPLFLRLTEGTWEAMSTPIGLALVEILSAARSDAQLREKLLEVVNQFEADQLSGVLEVAEAAGLHDRDAVERMVRLNRAAMRGLAIEIMLTERSREVENALELLSWYKRALTGWLAANPGERMFADSPTEAID